MAKGAGTGGRGGGAAAPERGPTGPEALTPENIRQIALDLGAVPMRQEVSIADVREAFYERFDPAGRTTTQQFDNALLDMPGIVLIRKDDPQSITARDRRFGIVFPGDRREALYVR